jgi:hypothetical protein
MNKINIFYNRQLARNIAPKWLPVVFAAKTSFPCGAAEQRRPATPVNMQFRTNRAVTPVATTLREVAVPSRAEQPSALQVCRSIRDAGPSPLGEALEVANLALADGGDHAMAGQLYREVVQRQPENVGTLVGLARCAVAAGTADV